MRGGYTARLACPNRARPCSRVLAERASASEEPGRRRPAARWTKPRCPTFALDPGSRFPRPGHRSGSARHRQRKDTRGIRAAIERPDCSDQRLDVVTGLPTADDRSQLLYYIPVAHGIGRTPARGSPANPMSDRDLEDKLRTIAASWQPGYDAAPLIDAIWALDRSEDASRLLALTVPR